MKKHIILILAVIFVLAIALTACRREGPAAPPTPAPATPAPATPAPPDQPPEPTPPPPPRELSFALALHPNDTPNFQGAIWLALQEATNTIITAELWPPSMAAERTTLLLASRNLPDMVELSRAQAFAYGNDGMFVPLDDLIARYAPNIEALLTPTASAPMRNPRDGLIYNIGRFNTLALSTEMTFLYRRDILEQMGEPEPSTMEEWLQLFRKVQEQFPDLIPLTAHSRGIDGFVGPTFDMGRMIGHFGIIGSEWDRGERRMTFLPITYEWKYMLQYYNTLYMEGILDPEYLTIDFTTFWSTRMVGGRAFACWTMNFARADMANAEAALAGHDYIQWYVAETPFNVVSGVRSQHQPGNPWVDRGFAFSACSDNHDVAMEFLNFTFSYEGARLLLYGVEGIHKRTNPDGTVERIHPFTESQTLRFEDGWLFNLPLFSQIEMASDMNQLNNATHFAKNSQHVIILPTLSRTEDTNEEFIALSADLNAFYTVWMDQFITGVRSFDEWDEYVRQAREIFRVDRAIEIVQQWLDNYIAIAAGR